MATARFADGTTHDIDDSAARHMQIGDTVITPPSDADALGGHRVGIITRRVWNGTELTVILNDPAPPVRDT